MALLGIAKEINMFYRLLTGHWMALDTYIYVKMFLPMPMCTIHMDFWTIIIYKYVVKRDFISKNEISSLWFTRICC